MEKRKQTDTCTRTTAAAAATAAILPVSLFAAEALGVIGADEALGLADGEHETEVDQALHGQKSPNTHV